MPVYPLDFYRRSELLWKRRVEASVQPRRDAPWIDRANESCPNCDLAVTTPFVSEYLPGCAVARHWVCRSCDFHWTTRFDPLLI